MTFLNQPAVVAIIFRLDANVGMELQKRKRLNGNFEQGRQARPESLKETGYRPREITDIYRYPVKGLTPEQLPARR